MSNHYWNFNHIQNTSQIWKMTLSFGDIGLLMILMYFIDKLIIKINYFNEREWLTKIEIKTKSPNSKTLKGSPLNLWWLTSHDFNCQSWCKAYERDWQNNKNLKMQTHELCTIISWSWAYASKWKMNSYAQLGKGNNKIIFSKCHANWCFWALIKHIIKENYNKETVFIFLLITQFQYNSYYIISFLV